MKISVISNGNEVQGTATMLIIFILQGNIKLLSEATKHKNVIICPFKITDILPQWQR